MTAELLTVNTTSRWPHRLKLPLIPQFFKARLDNILSWLFGFPDLSDDISIATVGVTSWIALRFVARRKSYKEGKMCVQYISLIDIWYDDHYKAYTMLSLCHKWRCEMSPQPECYVCFRSLMSTTPTRLLITVSCDSSIVRAAHM